MWSVGVLLYVLLTGCSPFGGDTKQETFCNISRCRLDFPDDLFEDVSEEARDLMRKLMVKDPSQRLNVSESLQHPWFNLYNGPASPLSEPSKELKEDVPVLTNVSSESPSRCSTSQTDSTSSEPTNDSSPAEQSKNTTTQGSNYSKSMPLRIGLSPDRRDTFKKNMDSLAQKFSGAEIVIIESHQRRATGNHTMPAGEVFKCTPVFILGEEQPCSDSGSDTVSEISTDSSSDRSSIYSDDSLDFIMGGKFQGRASFPFTGTESDRWDRHHSRVWPRECNGVVSKALSRFTIEPTRTSKSLVPSSGMSKTGLEALRERGGNLVVIREPVKAGRYTRYSEVHCESVQARIRRFQVQGGS